MWVRVCSVLVSEWVASNGTHRWFITFTACFTILRHYIDAINVFVWQTDILKTDVYLFFFRFISFFFRCVRPLTSWLMSITLLNRVMPTYSPEKVTFETAMYSIFSSKYLFVILTLCHATIYLFGIFIQKSNKIPPGRNRIETNRIQTKRHNKRTMTKSGWFHFDLALCECVHVTTWRITRCWKINVRSGFKTIHLNLCTCTQFENDSISI